MDQYVSWCLPAEELCLDTIWSKYEDVCKPQVNEVRARFDLLTSFRQGNRSVDEWYTAVQALVSLAKYPQEIANILHHDIFWFFLKDEEFVSKTINDKSIDLETFPASKGRQLAKKIEASKATVHHIKQVASDPQVVQINLMRHQCTDLLPSRNKKKHFFKSRTPSHKQYSSENQQQVPPYKKKFDSVEIPNMWRVSSVLQRSFSVKLVTSMDILQACVTRKKSFKSKTPKAHQLQAEHVYMQEDSICGQSEDLTSSDESFSLQVKIQCAQTTSKVPTTSHLITNFANKLKPHHNGNQYLRARLIHVLL